MATADLQQKIDRLVNIMASPDGKNYTHTQLCSAAQLSPRQVAMLVTEDETIGELYDMWRVTSDAYWDGFIAGELANIGYDAEGRPMPYPNSEMMKIYLQSRQTNVILQEYNPADKPSDQMKLIATSYMRGRLTEKQAKAAAAIIKDLAGIEQMERERSLTDRAETLADATERLVKEKADAS